MLEYGWGDYEQTYIVLTFKNKWTSQEFSDMISALYRDIRHVNKAVNIIVDMRHSHAPPIDIIGIVTQAVITRPDNLSRVIVLSRSMIWKRLYEAIMFNRIDDTYDIHFVKGVDTAYKLLVAVTGKS